ncbi:MAG: hypothetical protein NTX97_10795, partial [Bacteroidetes bacterium]|nr:hypothetical protein [Bacteroidota bacterium]
MENYNQNVKILRWVARIMAMSFAAFISIFALDVFSGTNSFWESIFAFFLHLIPTFLIILVIIISWHKEWIAGFAFLLFGLLH